MCTKIKKAVFLRMAEASKLANGGGSARRSTFAVMAHEVFSHFSWCCMLKWDGLASSFTLTPLVPQSRLGDKPQSNSK